MRNVFRSKLVRPACFCVLLCLSTVFMSQVVSVEFETPLAVKAHKRYIAETARAKQKYDRQIAKAKESYTKDLKRALKVAMRNGDLEEANAIQSEIDSLSQSPTDRLQTLLTSENWTLCWFSKSRQANAQKRISFLENGEIGQGRCKFEHSWVLKDNILSLLHRNGKVLKRLKYDKDTERWISKEHKTYYIKK